MYVNDLILKYIFYLFFRLFYDTASSPGFEITYLIGIFATFATGGVLSIIDTLFFGLTIHVSAMFKDLQDMINDVDKNAIRYVCV